MVKTIIWVAVGLLALSFFGVSLRSLYESPTNQDNLHFLTTLLMQAWDIVKHWFDGFTETLKGGVRFESFSDFFDKK